MTATISYLPVEIPNPESVNNFRGLKSCYVIELLGVIVFSVDREKCICKAKAVSKILSQLNKCN